MSGVDLIVLFCRLMIIVFILVRSKEILGVLVSRAFGVLYSHRGARATCTIHDIELARLEHSS